MLAAVDLFSIFAVVSFSTVCAAQCPAPTGAVKNVLDSLGTLDNQLNAMTGQVSGFSQSSGISGALAIQRSEAQLAQMADDVGSKGAALGSLNNCDSEHVARGAVQSARMIATLLDQLNAKKSDFAAVGVSSIVKNDLTSLQDKNNQWEKLTYEKMTCSGQNDVDAEYNRVNSAFNSAIQNYGGQSQAGPSKPSSCRNE